jgi:hypothetical protein
MVDNGLLSLSSCRQYVVVVVVVFAYCVNVVLAQFAFVVDSPLSITGRATWPAGATSVLPTTTIPKEVLNWSVTAPWKL